MIYVVIIIFLFNYQYSLLICVGNLKCNAVTGSGCTKILSNKTNCQLTSYCITKRSPEMMPCISFWDFKMKLLVVIIKPHKTKALLEVWDFVCLFVFFFGGGGYVVFCFVFLQKFIHYVCVFDQNWVQRAKETCCYNSNMTVEFLFYPLVSM